MFERWGGGWIEVIIQQNSTKNLSNENEKKKVLYVYINYMYFDTYIVHVLFGGSWLKLHLQS